MGDFESFYTGSFLNIKQLKPSHTFTTWCGSNQQNVQKKKCKASALANFQHP